MAFLAGAVTAEERCTAEGKRRGGPLVELLGDSRRLPLLLDEQEVRVFLDDDLHVPRNVVRGNHESVRSRTGLLPLGGESLNERSSSHRRIRNESLRSRDHSLSIGPCAR